MQEPSPADLRQHRTWLTSLIADGGRLLTESEQAGGLPEGAVRFSLNDVKAALDNLRTDERMWHGSMSAAERGHILETVF